MGLRLLYMFGGGGSLKSGWGGIKLVFSLPE